MQRHTPRLCKPEGAMMLCFVASSKVFHHGLRWSSLLSLSLCVSALMIPTMTTWLLHITPRMGLRMSSERASDQEASCTRLEHCARPVNEDSRRFSVFRVAVMLFTMTLPESRYKSLRTTIREPASQARFALYLDRPNMRSASDA